MTTSTRPGGPPDAPVTEQRGRAFLLGSDARSVDVEVEQLDDSTWRLYGMASDLHPVTAFLVAGTDGVLLVDPGSTVTWPEMLGAMASARDGLDVRWVFGHSTSPTCLGALPLIETTFGRNVTVLTTAGQLPVVSHYGTRLPVQLLRRGLLVDLGGRELVAEEAEGGTPVLRDCATGMVFGAETSPGVAALDDHMETVRSSLENVLLTTLAPIALEGRALAALAPVGRVTSVRTYVHDEGRWWELGARGGLRGLAVAEPPPPGATTLRIELSQPLPVILDLRFAPESAHVIADPSLISLVEALREPLVASMRRVLSMRESALATRRMRKDLRRDPLTGVGNRRALQEWGERPDCAALMIDLDRFKAVNDGAGHGCGDEVLRMVASAIDRLVRSRDLLVRYGGDEFLVLLDRADEAVALMVAERIRESIRKLDAPDQTPSGRVTVSVGVAAGGAPLDDLIKRADLALYRAKSDGRDAVRAQT